MKKSKLRLSVWVVIIFTLVSVVFNCECEVITEVPISSTSNSSSVNVPIGQYCNDDGDCFITNLQVTSNDTLVNYETIAGYDKLNDLLNYGYYTLKTNRYYRVFDSVSDGVTNFTSSNDISLDVVITNYYFTNALMTNRFTSSDNLFYSNFQTSGTNFISKTYDNAYTLISDNNIVGYSNYYTGIITNSNAITSFDLLTANDNPTCITTHNDKFYVVDTTDDKVYIYSSTGVDDGSFDLTSANGTPVGITTYNNRFYITDYDDDKVYIYSSTGVDDSSFDLTSDNGAPIGMTTYNNKFYIIDNIDDKVYIYSSTGGDEGSFNLTNDNNNPYGITTYNNKFYVTDSDNKVYIYSSTGVSEGSFNVTSDNGNPLGITTYNNKFYVIDFTDYKVYIYPFD